MYRFSRVICATALVSSLVTATSAARAQDEDRPHPPRESQDDTRRPIAVTINPLGLAFERYGANVEASPLPHHVIAGSLYTQSVPMWLVRKLAGYRLYSGRIGADGAFVGGSFVSMPLAYARLASDTRSVDLVRFNAVGAAFDIGVQKVTDSGFTIGGGVGVTYLSYTMPVDSRRLPLGIEPHVLPRLLLAAGWSF
jgi:hypothetical protein